MKILKNPEHALLVRPLGVGGRLRFAVTVMVLFDLLHPGTPLGEQELWQRVPGELPEGVSLDPGMPKLRGEFLLAGCACAPGGERRQALRATVRVGDLVKALDVFGARHWETRGGFTGISDPEPFLRMPLVWGNAFGGPGHPANPAGKGLQPGADGRVALPNLERPDQLIGSPADRPEPAGFGPRDLGHPERQRFAGTCDDRWRRERWPHFPDDLDYRCFNAAPEDQWLPDDFRGGEAIELRHFHPGHPFIASRVPDYRFRCFVTRRPELREAREEAWIFEELRLRRDTLWLFPSILRGVLLYRGTCAILDNEYADVERVLVTTESPGDRPRTLEDCLEEQRRRLLRAVPAGPVPDRRLREQLAEAEQMIAGVPRMLDDIRKGLLGQEPLVPRTPAELGARGRAALESVRAALRGLEAGPAPAGPGAGLDLGPVRARLDRMDARIQELAAEGEGLRAEGAAMKRELLAERDRMLEGPAGELMRRHGVQPEPILAEPAADPWRTRAFAFAVEAVKRLELEPEVQGRLRALGLTPETVRRAWLGWHPQAREWPAEAWGLQDPADPGRRVQVPPGLVLPRFQGRAVTALRILRQGRWDQFPDWLPERLEGSLDEPLALAAPFAGPGVPQVRVATELEARLLDSWVSDRCGILAWAEPSEPLPEAAARDLEAASVLLAILPAGAAEAERQRWAAAHPRALARALPGGRDLFQARALGLDLRAWILAALAEVAPGPAPGAAEPEPSRPELLGLAIPVLDPARLKAMVDQVLAEGEALKEPILKEAAARRAELEGRVREALLRAGQDPEALMAAPVTRGEGLAEAPARLRADFARQRAHLRSIGRLTPEVEARLAEAETELHRIATEGVERYQAGMARLAAGEAELEARLAGLAGGALPAPLRAAFREAGLDPDQLAPLTREQVAARHAAGASLRDTLLDGVDLSGLDLAGADFAGARCSATRFGQGRLAGACFDRALCDGADFTGADLAGARFQGGVLTGARFQEATLAGACFDRALLSGADFTRARGEGASFAGCILTGARFPGAQMGRTTLRSCILGNCDLAGAGFAGSVLAKCLLNGGILDRADFTGAALNDTLLKGVRGEAAVFRGADLDRLRAGEGSALPGADFSGGSLRQACLLDSDFTGATFAGCRAEEAILERCGLRGANLRQVSARRARFPRSDLEGADLRGLDLLMGSLRKARLVHTDLRDSNLFSVDFYQATLGRTRLDRANLKRTLLQGREELLA